MLSDVESFAWVMTFSNKRKYKEGRADRMLQKIQCESYITKVHLSIFGYS